MSSAAQALPITINGNTLSPEEPSSGLFGLNVQHTNYIFIQSREPLNDDEKDELEALGAEILEYVSQNTYLCRYEPQALHAIQDKPFVVLTGPYNRAFKVNAALKEEETQTTNQSADKPCTVDVLLHDNSDRTLEETKQDLLHRAGLSESEISLNDNKLTVTTTLQHLEDIALLDSVKTINEVMESELCNNLSREILRVDAPSGGSPIAYSGKTQLIAVADTGFDLGQMDQVHPAFQGRVKELIPIGRKKTGNSSDPHGHGTHVCGSVLGNGFSETMGGIIQGTAPQAQLLMQSLLIGGNEIDTSNVREILSMAYSLGARIHTNSWGPRWKNRQECYGQNAYSVDEFVWKNQDLLVCFAAGNDGENASNSRAVGDTSSAKNCLTVGATESSRPSNHFKYDPKKLSPNDITAIASFSSQGPTVEGRLKPDVMAPGTAILSTKSRAAKDWSEFGVSKDSAWKFESGTSMATPLVAGCAAVLREYIIDHGHSNPSAALLKAMLINGAIDLEKTQGPNPIKPAPNNVQGYGRVDLQNSFIKPGSMTQGFVDGALLQQGQVSMPIVIPVPSPSGLQRILNVTLAYSDLPGPLLQTDLSLIVFAGDGSSRHGNMGLEDGFDDKNNVERVTWKNIPPGDAKNLSEVQDDYPTSSSTAIYAGLEVRSLNMVISSNKSMVKRKYRWK